MKRKEKRKFRMKTIDMNFVDATVLKGKRFETKQNFDFKSDIYTNKHFNILISVSTHNPSILKYIFKRENQSSFE